MSRHVVVWLPRKLGASVVAGGRWVRMYGMRGAVFFAYLHTNAPRLPDTVGRQFLCVRLRPAARRWRRRRRLLQVSGGGGFFARVLLLASVRSRSRSRVEVEVEVEVVVEEAVVLPRLVPFFLLLLPLDRRPSVRPSVVFRSLLSLATARLLLLLLQSSPCAVAAAGRESTHCLIIIIFFFFFN